MAKTWQLQEAKSKLSEVITEAETTGPQTITRRGDDAAVVLSLKDYKRLLERSEKLSQCFTNSPLADEDLDFTRSTDSIREFNFS